MKLKIPLLCGTSSTMILNVFLQLYTYQSSIEMSALSLTYLSRSLDDRWGTKDDRVPIFLYPTLFSAFRRASTNLKSVHSIALSSVCLSFSLPASTTVLQSKMHVRNITMIITASQPLFTDFVHFVLSVIRRC